MTDKELSYIIKIAETNSVTKSAELLFISQPALTQTIQKIEKEVGFAIFKREKTGLYLTDNGKEYVKAAYKIQKIYRDMELEIGYIAKSIKGKIKVGITSYLGAMILPFVLSRFKEKFPLITVELLEGNSTELENMLISGKIDVAVMHQPIAGTNLLLDVIIKDNFILAISHENKDIQRKNIKYASVDMLNQFPMIMISSDQRIGQIENHILNSLNVTPKVVYTTKNFDTARNLAAVGLGITLLPKSYVKYFDTKLHPLYIDLPSEWNASWDLCLAYPKGLKVSNICNEFALILKDYIFENKGYFKDE